MTPCTCQHCGHRFAAAATDGHRVVAGDSTSQEAAAAAVGQRRPHLMVTDPPYGVLFDPSWRDRLGLNRMGKSEEGARHYMDGGRSDTEARWDDVWAHFPGDVAYVWCSDNHINEVWQALEGAGLIPHHVVVWAKSVLTMTRTHYWCSHEFCVYAWRKEKTAHWVGKAGQSSVWNIASPKHIMGGSQEEKQDHPAQKPVECMRRPIENNSKLGDAVYEPFLGSGTTLIAAEMTGRQCCAIEISPAYVDLSVARWEAFTGKRAFHEKTGEAFAR